jgi:uncharacterized membrane protein
MGETLYSFTSHALCFQFLDSFVKHFFPRQFGIDIKNDCEAIIYGIKCNLDLHPNYVLLYLDMANVFNSMLRRVIFEKLCVVGESIIHGIPFVREFYAFELPLFYIHCNCESNVIINLSTIGTH